MGMKGTSWLGRTGRSVLQALSPAPELRLGASGPAPGPGASSWERARPHLPLVSLLLALAIVAVLRYMLVRQHLDMGPDIANYLTTMNTFFGHDVTGTGLLRPPLIAIPLKAFTLTFGLLTGAKLLGVVVSVAMGIPFFLIARRISHPWIAVAATLLFVITPPYSNMLSWGYITMFGILFTLLSAYYFVRVLESPTRWHIFLAGLFASFVAGFHQLTAAFFAPFCIVLLLALLLLNRDLLRRNIRPFAAAAAVAVVLTLPYVPIYLHLLDMQSSQGGEAGLSTTPFLEFASGIWYARWLWAIILGIVLGAGCLVWMRRYDKPMATLLAVLLLFPLCLTIFTLQPPFVEMNRRAQYFLFVPIWAISGFALSLLWSWSPSALRGFSHHLPRLAAAAIVVYLLITGGTTSQRALDEGLDFYGYLDDSRWAAVQWIGENTPEDATIVAYPENLGWWTEGAASRAVLEVTERNMEANIVEKQRAFAAEQVLSRNRGLHNGHVRLATTYPYNELPGNPVVGFYTGGRYQDLLVLSDNQSRILVNGGGALPLAALEGVGFEVRGDASSMEMVTTYGLDGATITQAVRLDQGTQTAVVTYAIHSGGRAIARLWVPIIFCHRPASVSTSPQGGQAEVVQELEAPFSGKVPVTTRLAVAATGAVAQAPGLLEDQVSLAFDIEAADARITLSFDISSTEAPPDDEEVTAYEVPRIIRDRAVGYLAVDLAPGSPMWNDLPRDLEDWLSGCPYYRLVYSDVDFRIYEVVAAALP